MGKSKKRSKKAAPKPLRKLDLGAVRGGVGEQPPGTGEPGTHKPFGPIVLGLPGGDNSPPDPIPVPPPGGGFHSPGGGGSYNHNQALRAR